MSEFDAITLGEMESVRLMDRRDTKFMFRAEQLPLVLQKLAPAYRILEIDNLRLQRYISRYYDTEEFKFYLDHHNGRMNRYKVRLRRYTDCLLHFLEVKYKDNKGRTRKKRMEIPAEDFEKEFLSAGELKYVHKRMGYDPGTLNPVVRIEYSRIALVNRDMKERATIDLFLTFKANDRTAEFHHIVIAEVKQDGLSMSSDFIRLMGETGIHQVRFSKYCFGINMLYPQLKYNRFKRRIMAYNKVAYGTVYIPAA